MLRAFRFQFDPSTAQPDSFAGGAGTACRVWNWGLADWQRQRDAGGKPDAYALKRQFSAAKPSDPAWLSYATPPARKAAPVRYEYGVQVDSGQGENCVHV